MYIKYREEKKVELLVQLLHFNAKVYSRQVSVLVRCLIDRSMVRVSTRIISSSCQESVLFDERYHCFYLMMKYVGEVRKYRTIFADETAIFGKR